jgi:hypothetical protein
MVWWSPVVSVKKRTFTGIMQPDRWHCSIRYASGSLSVSLLIITKEAMHCELKSLPSIHFCRCHFVFHFFLYFIIIIFVIQWICHPSVFLRHLRWHRTCMLQCIWCVIQSSDKLLYKPECNVIWQQDLVIWNSWFMNDVYVWSCFWPSILVLCNASQMVTVSETEETRILCISTL